MYALSFFLHKLKWKNCVWYTWAGVYGVLYLLCKDISFKDKLPPVLLKENYPTDMINFVIYLGINGYQFVFFIFVNLMVIGLQFMWGEIFIYDPN